MAKTETIEKAEAGVEFAYLDFKLKDYFQVRAELNLVPIGITNYLHEPTTFLTVHRSVTETTIIPSTWGNSAYWFMVTSTRGGCCIARDS